MGEVVVKVMDSHTFNTPVVRSVVAVGVSESVFRLAPRSPRTNKRYASPLLNTFPAVVVFDSANHA